MVTLSLLNRWTNELEPVQPGERRQLNGIDEYRIWISFSSDDSEIEIQINEEKFIQESQLYLDLPILVNAEGCCSVRVFNFGGTKVQRYKFEVPTRTLLDPKSMVAALALFADKARKLSPAITKEQLEALPFFSPNTILNSLNNPDIIELDDEIEKALPSLNRVCNRPRRSLIVERRVMPIDRVRRIPPDAIEHLASRPELWQSCTATRITPARLRSEVPEETLDLYENRVAATLVRRILRWLAQRIGDVDRAYYQTETLHKSLFTGYQYNFRREQRIKTLWKQLDTLREQEYLQQYEKSRELKDKISRQAAEISTCLDSLLYKNLCGKPDVVSPLKPTNILNMDSDYRHIKHLWEVMDRFDSSLNTPKQVSNQRDIQSDYACYVYGCVLLSLRWIGFLPAHTKPENCPDELDFNRALQWERWTVVVKPPEHGTFNINIDFIWEPMLNGTGGGISQKTKSWQNHPTRIRLVVVPIARSLFGNQNEVGETLNKLYKNSLNQVRKTSNPPKRKNRKDLEVQTYVQLVHPTDPREPNMSEDVPPELIQRMLSIGENFMHPNDYKSFVLAEDGATPNFGRIGCFPASPLDLNTLERFQRLFRFHTLGVDLLYGIHPASCPVCDYDLKDVLSNFKDESGLCPSCNAEWSWRICRNCDRKVPKLQPRRMKPASQRQTQQSYAVQAMAREQLLSRDQLSALCESDEVPESGNTRVICPHCGACTGRGETAQKCRRCRDNRFGQG